MRQKRLDLTQGSLTKGILFYTLPIILTSYLQLLYNAADLIVVGRFCGSIAVAAVGNTGAITNLLINLLMGLSVGAGVSVAHAIGARETENVKKLIGTAEFTAVTGGAALTILGFFLTPYVLRWMATPDNVRPLSTVYMRVYFGGMIFNLVYNYSASVLRAAGDTRTPLLVLSLAGLLNVILNLVFVISLKMSVAGVALATVISQAASAAALVWILWKRKDVCCLEWRYFGFHEQQFRRIIQIGLPAGIQGATFSISNVLIQSSINSFGDAMISGNAAVSNVEGFCYATVNGFHQAAVNYVGQNLGAHKYDRIRRISKLCVGYAVCAGLLVGGAIFLFREVLLGLYITDSQSALQAGMHRMLFTTLPYAMFGIQDVESGVLRGFSASSTAMLISVLGICGIRLIWIGTVFQIPACHTPTCLYLSYLISWTLTGIAGFAAVRLTRKKWNI